jgi:hypothetical protein
MPKQRKTRLRRRKRRKRRVTALHSHHLLPACQNIQPDRHFSQQSTISLIRLTLQSHQTGASIIEPSGALAQFKAGCICYILTV